MAAEAALNTVSVSLLGRSQECPRTRQNTLLEKTDGCERTRGRTLPTPPLIHVRQRPKRTPWVDLGIQVSVETWAPYTSASCTVPASTGGISKKSTEPHSDAQLGKTSCASSFRAIPLCSDQFPSRVKEETKCLVLFFFANNRSSEYRHGATPEGPLSG